MVLLQHFFSKYVLSTYSVPDPVGIENKQGRHAPCPAAFQAGETEVNKQEINQQGSLRWRLGAIKEIKERLEGRVATLVWMVSLSEEIMLELRQDC